MSVDELVKTCCVCKVSILPSGEFVTDKDALSLGYKLTHTFLSKECINEYYPGLLNNSVYNKLPETCYKRKV